MNEQTFNVFVDIDGDGNPIPPYREPVYEYRVVCVDGVDRLPRCSGYVQALRRMGHVNESCRALDDPHAHTLERRPVGPWEAT